MFSKDALLLIGHGSSTLPGAARLLLAHAEEIRQSGRFGEVAVGMLRGEPGLAAAYDSLTARTVHIVPFFLEDGYFTRITIPDLLLPRVAGGRFLRFCKPIGSHDSLAGLMEARIIRYCEMYGIDAKTLSILLVGHGSSKKPGRALALKRHAERLEATGHFGWVRVAHLEEPPMVPETLAGARGYVVAVIGYFANEGTHATEDLPRMIAAEREQRGMSWPPVHDLGIIGTDEALPRLIIDQVTRLI